MNKKLWGGRFKKAIDRDFFGFQRSIAYDSILAQYDIVHSLIHVSALRDAGILTSAEVSRLKRVFADILKEIGNGSFRPHPQSEDIHTEIQNRVEEKLGALAHKMHALRSRNDQVVFDEKLYCLHEAITVGAQGIYDLLEALGHLASRYSAVNFVGYTHTQRAQVISFATYASAYGEMFSRDNVRLLMFCRNLDVSIGAGALAGSSLGKEYAQAIDSLLKVLPKEARRLTVSGNTVDSVSDRDFIIEFLSIISIIQTHLSRLAEDLILYSTKEFNYIDLPEEFCTGSSLMPHKKNPDFLELVRGYSGRIYGNLISILTTMKGLPLSYNRDMQLDKEPLFSSVAIIKDELKIMAKFIKGIKLNVAVIEEALKDESLYATELAEYLVKEQKAPFKEAHDIVGRLIRHSLDDHRLIKNMSDEHLKEFHPSLNQKVIAQIMDPQYAVASKRSFARRAAKVKGFKK